MTQAQQAHTEGPWELPHLVKEDTTCNCGHVFAGYVTVCTVHDHTHDSGSGEFLTQEEAEANAKLIADAWQLPTLRADNARLKDYAAYVEDKVGMEEIPLTITRWEEVVYTTEKLCQSVTNKLIDSQARAALAQSAEEEK